MTNKRLDMLEQITKGEGADSFAWYGLAMEYRKLGRIAEALVCFDTLKGKDPEYLAMYLMAGQMLSAEGKPEDARVWLEAGIELATRQGNQKALSELRDALSAL
jgi:tetratricopeptide (TPR) repeat protein